MESLTDEQLVAEYLKGDQKAFEQLVSRHLNAMYNFVFKYAHTVSETEDITQEAFIKIWKNLKKFDKRYKFKTWAFTVAKNTALDHLKRKGLVPFSEIEEIQGSFIQSLVSEQPLPEQAIEKLENIELVGHAVRKLPEKYQQVINMYYDQQLNFREISELLKESIDTIKTRHRRALIYLKRFIE